MSPIRITSLPFSVSGRPISAVAALLSVGRGRRAREAECQETDAQSNDDGILRRLSLGFALSPVYYRLPELKTTTLNPERPPVSVVILTRDEEANIEACLDSLTPWYEEIWVVDSGSTDRTVDIARSKGAQVVFHEWGGYPQQWNWAVSQLPFKNEFLCIFAADERATEEFVLATSEALRNHPEADLIFTRMKYIWMGRWIRHGAYFDKYHERIGRKGKYEFDDRAVGEHAIITGPQADRRLGPEAHPLRGTGGGGAEQAGINSLSLVACHRRQGAQAALGARSGLPAIASPGPALSLFRLPLRLAAGVQGRVAGLFLPLPPRPLVPVPGRPVGAREAPQRPTERSLGNELPAAVSAARQRELQTTTTLAAGRQEQEAAVAPDHRLLGRIGYRDHRRSSQFQRDSLPQDKGLARTVLKTYDTAGV
jgi:hypothetical protein